MSSPVASDPTRVAVSPGPARAGPAAGVPGKQPTRVLLVCADQLIGDDFARMLSIHHDRLEVVGRLHVPEDAVLAPTMRFDADVVLFDIPGTGRNGELEAAVEITRRCGPSRIVVLTDDADERSLFEALRGGIAGYLLKSLSGAELVEHLVRAGRGEIVMDPTMASKIALRAVRFGDGARWPGIEIGLSRRESEVLGHLVDGQSNREISETLVISQETVKIHLRSIYRKLGVKDRGQAVADALRQGMIA